MLAFVRWRVDWQLTNVQYWLLSECNYVIHQIKQSLWDLIHAISLHTSARSRLCIFYLSFLLLYISSLHRRSYLSTEKWPLIKKVLQCLFALDTESDVVSENGEEEGVFARCSWLRRNPTIAFASSKKEEKKAMTCLWGKHLQCLIFSVKSWQRKAEKKDISAEINSAVRWKLWYLNSVVK